MYTLSASRSRTRSSSRRLRSSSSFSRSFPHDHTAQPHRTHKYIPYQPRAAAHAPLRAACVRHLPFRAQAAAPLRAFSSPRRRVCLPLRAAVSALCRLFYIYDFFATIKYNIYPLYDYIKTIKNSMRCAMWLRGYTCNYSSICTKKQAHPLCVYYFTPLP